MSQQPGNSRRRSLAGALLPAATALVLAVVGMWRMFAHFPGYDDEGYILFTLRNYLEHGGLYAGVYSQYGPAFYAIHDVLHRLTGWTIDHEFARWSTLVLWIGAAAGSAGLVWQASRSAGPAWFGGVAVFLFLHQLSEEAFHPGSMVVCLLPALLWALLELEQRGRPLSVAALAGMGVAVLGLLKINVGALFAAGVLGWVLLCRMERRRPGLALATGLGVATALMHRLLQADWVRIFLLVFASGLTGLGLAARPGPPFRRVALIAGGAGASAAAVLVCMVVTVRDTPFQALWEGVVLGPLQHAGNYSYAVDWRPGTLVLALASPVVLALHGLWMKTGRTERAHTLLAGLRVALLGGVLAAVVLLETYRVIGALFSFALPWLWVWVLPLSGTAEAGRSAGQRMLIACVLLFQALHAYPVGGIQICWGLFLLFPLVAATLPETGRWLGERWPRWTWLVAVLPVSLTAGKLGWTAHEYRALYVTNVEVALPGAGGLRLGEREALVHHLMVLNSALHADRLFSLPGMFSYNLWSEVPAPTLRNTTLWYSLLTPKEQADIIAALEQARRPALIVDAASVQILRASGVPPAGPLHDYLLTRFQPAFSHQGLGFWIRRDRTVLPADTVRRLPGETGALQLHLIGLDEPVASAEWRSLDHPGAARLRLGADNSRVTVQPVKLDATPGAAAREVAWPWRADGPTGIVIRGPEPPVHGPGAAMVLELKAADGRVVAKLLLVDGG